MESTVRMITNQSSYGNAWKRQKMDTLVLLIKSAFGLWKEWLKMNIPEEATQKNSWNACPRSRRPTIAQLTENGWRSVESIMPESEAKNYSFGKKIGGRGIVEYPLNKIIY